MTPSLSISICLNVLTFCRISSSVYLHDKHEGTKVRRSSHSNEKRDKYEAMTFNLFGVKRWNGTGEWKECVKRGWSFQFQKGGHLRSPQNLHRNVWPAGTAWVGCKNSKNGFLMVQNVGLVLNINYKGFSVHFVWYGVIFNKNVHKIVGTDKV